MDDVRLPDLHAVAVLRSPYAHAKIKSIDVSEALKAPGVVDVVTAAEAGKLTKPLPRVPPEPIEQYCMGYPKIRHVGEYVAAVVAKNRYLAQEAIDLIQVDYEPLPVVTNSEDAMRPDAPVLHDKLGSNVMYHDVFEYGEVDKDFKRADIVVEDKFRWNRSYAAPLETYGCVASFDQLSGMLTFTTAFQLPYFVGGISESLGVPINKMRFNFVDVGGAFGSKTVHKHLVLTAMLAMHSGKPVKFVEDRTDNMSAGDCHGDDRKYEVKLAAKKDGTLLSLDVKVIDDYGAYAIYGPATNINPLAQAVGPYRIRSVREEVYAVLTNKCQQNAYRGFGSAAWNFFLERMVDTAAGKLGLRPDEIRFKNFIRPNQFPYTIPTGNVYDSGNYPEVLKKVLELSNYKQLRRNQLEARKRGKYLGIGLASTQERTNFSMLEFTLIYPKMVSSSTPETVTVKIDPQAGVTVGLYFASNGQGHETTTAQIVADELGVPFEDISVTRMETVGPFLSVGPGGSRLSSMLAGALTGATGRLKEKMCKISAHHWKMAVKDVEFKDGKVVSKGKTRKSMTIKEIAEIAYSRGLDMPKGVEPGLDVTYTYNHPYQTPPDEKRRSVFYPIMSHASSVAVVEVDVETGQVKPLKFFVVHDCGRMINPMIVEGQIQGGIMQGIATALYEEFMYDENGQLLNGTFMDYLIPTPREAVDIVIGHVQTPSPFTAFGVKGVGEGGRMSAPAAIANAVVDALEPFGVKANEVPMSPDRILKLIRLSKTKPHA